MKPNTEKFFPHWQSSLTNLTSGTVTALFPPFSIFLFLSSCPSFIETCSSIKEFLFLVKGVIFQFTSYLLPITYDYKMILCYVTPVVFQTDEVSMIIMNGCNG